MEAVGIDPYDPCQVWVVGGVPIRGRAALTADCTGLWVVGPDSLVRYEVGTGDIVGGIRFDSLGMGLFGGGSGDQVKTPWLFTGVGQGEATLNMVGSAGLAVIDGDGRQVLRQWGFDTPLVAAAGDGSTLLATLDEDGLAVWDTEAARRRVRQHLPFAVGSIEAMAMAADGSRVAIGGWQGAGGWFAIWSVDEGEVSARVETDQRVRSLRFADDGAAVVGCAGRSGTVLVWSGNNAGRVELVGELPAPVTAVGTATEIGSGSDAAGVSVTGVVAGGADGSVRVWLPGRGEVAAFSGHADSVWSVEAAGDRIVSCAADGTARCWTVAAKHGIPPVVDEVSKPERVVHRRPITTIDVSTDGNRVLSISTDLARVLAVDRDWSVVSSWHDRPLTAGSLASAGEAAVLAGPGWVARWGEDGSLGHPNESYRGSVHSVASSPGAEFAYSAGIRGLMMWDLGRGGFSGDEPPFHMGSMKTVAGSPDGRWLAVARGQQVGVWRLAQNGRADLNHELHGASELGSVSIADGAGTVAAVDSEGRVILWHEMSGWRPRETGGSAKAHTCAVNADGTILAACGDHFLDAWRVSTGEGLLSWHTPIPITAIAVVGETVVAAVLNRLLAFEPGDAIKSFG